MTTVVDRVRQHVHEVPEGAFVHSRALVDAIAGPSPQDRSAVDVALHRMRDSEHLVPVRRGLYFKGRPTRFGPTRPDPLRAGVEVAKAAGYEDGVGPAGYTAARMFGLTTQVPARVDISVPGRAPADFKGVHFTSRSAASRRGLGQLEVALLEVLRDWPRYSEETWSTLTERVRELAASGELDVEHVGSAARRESHTRLRERAGKLLAYLHASAEHVDKKPKP